MNKYHTSKIYKIVSKNCVKYYVGGTIQELNIRFNNHKYKYKHNINNETSREVLDCGDCSIVLIEIWKCDNKKQLETRELYWINKLLESGEELVNSKIGIKNINSEKKKKLMSKRYKKNSKKISKDITFDRKSYMTEYNKNHKEKSKEYNRIRYLDNKYWNTYNQEFSNWLEELELY